MVIGLNNYYLKETRKDVNKTLTSILFINSDKKINEKILRNLNYMIYFSTFNLKYIRAYIGRTYRIIRSSFGGWTEILLPETQKN
jgi:hypothetical protein